jgi:chromosome segregation ATPase
VAHEPEIRALHVSVRIADDGTPMPAEEMTAIWEKARSALEDGLRKLQATTRENQLREREREIRSAHEALASSRQDYEAAVSRLSALARDLGDGSQAEIQQQLSATLAELRQLKLKMIGLQARRDAIERRIDDLRKVAEEASIDDPVIAELQSAVSAREKVLEHRKRLEKLGVPGGEATFIAEAEANLTDARLQLLRARREAVGGSEGDVLQQLNNELSMLIIQAAEIEATLHATAEMAEELKAKSSAERWSEMDLLRGRLDLAKNRLQAAELTVFDRENRPLPPQEEVSIRPLDEVLAPDAESVAP